MIFVGFCWGLQPIYEPFTKWGFLNAIFSCKESVFGGFYTESLHWGLVFYYSRDPGSHPSPKLRMGAWNSNTMRCVGGDWVQPKSHQLRISHWIHKGYKVPN